MSFQAMTWAQEASKAHNLPPLRRLVLLTMANYADQDGDNVFPSLSTLVEDTGLSKNAIRGHIRAMQESGLILEADPSIARAKIKRADRIPNVYRLAMTRPSRTFEDGLVRGAATEPRTGSGVQMTTLRGSTAEPEPVKEPKELSKDNSNARARTREAAPAGPEAEFEKFYQAYPRHENKGRARRAYKAARRKVSQEVLLAGVERYTARMRREGKEPRFIAAPATWLNGERWDDEPATAPKTVSAWDPDYHKTPAVWHE